MALKRVRLLFLFLQKSHWKVSSSNSSRQMNREENQSHRTAKDMTNPSSHSFDRHVSRPRVPAPVQLSTCKRAALFVTKCVLKARAQKGENWFRVAHLSKQGIDFATVLRFVPQPKTSPIKRGQFQKLYKAALECTISPFDSKTDFDTIDDFVDWISRSFEYSTSALILACIYIDRLFAFHPELFLRKTNLHRCFAIAYMIAGKFLEDQQTYYAKPVSKELQIEAAHLGFLESLFLAAIRYDLNVSEDQPAKAEILFMTEAIESDWSKEVALCLREENIQGYRAAILHKSENERRRIVDQSYIRSGQVDDRDLDCEVRPDRALQRCYPWQIVKELARAQLYHDFKSEGSSSSDKRRILNSLTSNGQQRYLKLLALADGKTLRDLRLPRLSRADRTAGGGIKLSRWEQAKGLQFEHFGKVDGNDALRWAWRDRDLKVQSVRVSDGCVDESSKRKVEKIMRRR